MSCVSVVSIGWSILYVTFVLKLYKLIWSKLDKSIRSSQSLDKFETASNWLINFTSLLGSICNN